MIGQIETREHTGKSGKTYLQWFDGTRMIGCGCDEAKAVHVSKYNFKPCKHMIAANTPVVVEVAQPAPRSLEWKAPGNQPASGAWLWLNRKRFNTEAGRRYLAERTA